MVNFASLGLQTPEPIHLKFGTFDRPTHVEITVTAANGGGVGIWLKLYQTFSSSFFGSFNACTGKRGFSLNAPKNVFLWWVCFSRVLGCQIFYPKPF